MTDTSSMKELKDALKKVKTRKAPGSDGITGKMHKDLGACSRVVLLKMLNHSWMKGGSTYSLDNAVIIPVPKKGKDKKNPRRCRTLSLLSSSNLSTLPRTSKMHSRRKRFWKFSSISQMHLTRSGKRGFF